VAQRLPSVSAQDQRTTGVTAGFAVIAALARAGATGNGNISRL